LLTFDQIKELVELISQRGLGGLEVERSGFRLRIEGRPVLAASAGPAAAPAQPSPAAAAAPAPAPPAVFGAPEPHAAAAPEPGLPPGTHILNSPIVGTFYRAPSPEAQAFVQVGSRVAKGQVLCIIEAMKLMNEIESDVDGEVLQVFPQNAQAVEFGEPLFALRPA
jgi:acetyl-CoA carboxylase biotin carboxyl carrier protein